MAHRYGHLVAVDAIGGQPAAFTWRGVQYAVRDVLATWHLRDRWWEPAPPSAPCAGGSGGSSASIRASAGGSTGASDRHYYRVRCAGEQIFDLYYDAAVDHWVLDRVYD